MVDHKGCIFYDDNYEEVFLKKVPTSFAISNETRYSFAASDILIKLPSLECGGSLSKSVNLKFYFDFRKWIWVTKTKQTTQQKIFF